MKIFVKKNIRAILFILSILLCGIIISTIFYKKIYKESFVDNNCKDVKNLCCPAGYTYTNNGVCTDTRKGENAGDVKCPTTYKLKDNLCTDPYGGCPLGYTDNLDKLSKKPTCNICDKKLHYTSKINKRCCYKIGQGCNYLDIKTTPPVESSPVESPPVEST
jgi:hypothetical protein